MRNTTTCGQTMDKRATKLTVETTDGETGVFFAYRGLTFSAIYVETIIRRDFADHVRDVINFEMHDDDVFLATYPKAGTHWAWEVIMMLRQGSADYIKTDKEAVFLDIVDPAKIAQVPGPRVINSHFSPRCIPRSVVTKGTKIVHVQRNVKDVMVSAYHHYKRNEVPFTDTFSKFIDLFLGEHGVYVYTSWAQYVKDWENFTRQRPDQILNIYFEDMKEDPVREIQRINRFLGCDASEGLVAQIADACSFQKLKHADQDKQHHFPEMKAGIMYRKGEVGDWKNWLTVAQDERVDEWIEENLTNTDLKFRYTL